MIRHLREVDQRRTIRRRGATDGIMCEFPHNPITTAQAASGADDLLQEVRSLHCQ